MLKLKLFLCLFFVPIIGAYGEDNYQKYATGTFSFSGFFGNKFSGEFESDRGRLKLRFFGQGRDTVPPVTGIGVIVSCSRRTKDLVDDGLGRGTRPIRYRLKAYPGYAEFWIYDEKPGFSKSLITKCHATQGPAIYADISGEGSLESDFAI